MNSDPNSSPLPVTPGTTPLTSEDRNRLASDLSKAENGKRLILSIIAIFPAIFLARLLFGVGLFGTIICYCILLYLIWGVHRRFVQKHYLKSSDAQLLDEHRTRRPTLGMALGCFGGLFAMIAALLLVVVGLGIALAATSPDEQKMRAAVFGQLGRGLEQLGDLSGALGGPKIVYKDYLLGSVLVIDYGKGAEPDILAYGAGGRVWVTDEVKKIHDLAAPLSR